MTKDNKAKLQVPAEWSVHDAEPDRHLRYKAEPVRALKECRTQMLRQRRGMYELVATVYAISLRTYKDLKARNDLLTDPYWEGKFQGEIKCKRDLFRIVSKFVFNADTEKEGKKASKYAAVMFYLDNNEISPDDAAAAIEANGGLEKVSRYGVSAPSYVDPRDVGDGMTPTGDEIDYYDSKKRKQKAREDDVEVDMHDYLSDELKNIEDDNGDLTILASYFKMKGKPLTLSLYRTAAKEKPTENIQLEEPLQAAISVKVDGSDETVLAIIGTATRVARVRRTQPGQVAVVLLVPSSGGPSAQMRLAGVRKMSRRSAKEANII